MSSALFSASRKRARRLVALSILAAVALAASVTASASATTGPYAVKWSQYGDLVNHTVYQPTVKPPGQMPVLIWGEGGCVANGLLYNGFLSEIASYGITVIASGGPAQIGISTVSLKTRSRVTWPRIALRWLVTRAAASRPTSSPQRGLRWLRSESWTAVS